MKKLLALILSFAFILSICTSAYATETASDSYSARISRNESTLSPMAATIPSSSNSTPYVMSITNLIEGHSTYSRYYFAPSSGGMLTINGNLWPSGTEDGAKRSVKILLFQMGIEDNIDSYTVSFTDKEFIAHNFTGLDVNSHYYFRFDNLNAHPPYANRYVDGSITVF